MTLNITGWGAFWCFMIVYVCLECFVFLKGYDTVFWTYRTPAELEAQRKILGLTDSKGT